ncbi:MAG: ABC transporter permease [Actinomycetia bacterium]|nr:ABC transporter permease [Actinomycetes bacterium]
MTRVALRGLLGRKVRAALTALAVVFGVAMISGTFVLTDTIDRAFETLFTEVYEGTDIVITGVQAFETDFSQPPPFRASLLEEVRALDGVDVAIGGIQDFAQLTDRDGEPIRSGGAPTFGFGIGGSEPRFNPLVLTSGDWAAGPREVVIDAATAEEHGFGVGDTIGVRARGPVKEFRIVGTARFGNVDSIGGATAAYFDVPTAQRLFEKEGQLDGIQIAIEPGASSAAVIEQIERILPERTQALTGTEQAEDETSTIEEFTSFIQTFLLAFGGIALFVGAFVIFNTLSITVTQRTREFATLRTLGASRRQVLGSVVVEALVIGLLASVVGLFAGLGLAIGLNEVFVAFGVDLPSTDTVLAARTVVVGLIVGTAVTVIAGIVPAVRATRVPPISAVREGAVLPKGRLARLAPVVAAAVAIVGLALILLAMFAGGLGTTEILVLIGVGVVALFIGIALVSAKLVEPLAHAVGWIFVRVGGTSGRLARQNATRNPARTAATAGALMIGLALVTFVAVLASGLTRSIGDAIDDQLATDFVAVSETGFTPFEPGLDRVLRGRSDVLSVSPVRGENVMAELGAGAEAQLTGVDPESIPDVYRFEWVDGTDETVRRLARDEAILESEFATDHGLSVGDALRIQSPSGRFVQVAVRGIHRAPPFWQMLGDLSVPTDLFDEIIDNPRNLYTFIRAEGGASGSTAAALTDVVESSFPGIELESQAGFIERNEDQIGRFVLLLYVLLALSVIVSLFGIINTLVLSVFERTRELGMLRAIGMTRRQARRMIRHESIITALIGASIGMPLGIVLAAIVTTRLSSEGLSFVVPWPTLVVFVAASVLAGIVAAVVPARRAARLNVLNALHYE